MLEVHIDKGMRNGQRITFEGEGDSGPNLLAGDVVFVIEEQPNAVFERRGNDLITHVELDLITALAGGSFDVQQLDGEWYHINIPEGTVIKPGDTKLLPDKGMPVQRLHSYGNMIIMFDIKFPETGYTGADADTLRKLLPPAKRLSVSPDAAEEVELIDVDPSSIPNDSAMDDDDEDGYARPEGVQCASQ